jgi:hypothetical protein
LLYRAYLDGVTHVDLRAFRAGVADPALLLDRSGDLIVDYSPWLMAQVEEAARLR